MPPVVREHKQVVVVRGPSQLLNSIPVEVMQRSKQQVFLPQGCFATVNPLPAGAQLLRSVPLRSNGGWSEQSDEKAVQEFKQHGDQSSSNLAEQAWGIPFTTEEFVQEAQLRGHPKLFTQLMPGILADAVCANFSECPSTLVRARAAWFAKWTSRAKALAKEEAQLKANMPDHMAKILQPKRLLLWKEILVELGYSDLGVIDELATGTELVGEVPPCGVFEKVFKAAEITVDSLATSSKSSRFQQFYKCRSSGDAEVDELVFSKTKEEVNFGWARGPYKLDELPEGATISRRFGLRQPGKIRLIDDLSASSVNQTVQCSESPKPHSVDFVAALILSMLRQGVGTSIMGRSFDLKSAYKQLAISAKSLEFAFVAVYNPETRRPEIYQLLAAPFGATRSVYSFLRASHALWFTGVKGLNLMWSCFFDDFLVFSPDGLVNNTESVVQMLFQLLGWKFAVDGDKANDFALAFSALGVRINLEKFAFGKVEFSNTEKRTIELSEAIGAILSRGTMTVLESQKLRGRMQFADGQLFGRLGRLCMRAVTQHAFPYRGKQLGDSTKDALRRFAVFLKFSEPRVLQLTSDNVWKIFTDACYEPQSKNWVCGLGGVLVDPLGATKEYFAVQLSKQQQLDLGANVKKTIIFEAELLALVLAFSVWRRYLPASALVCFVDNNSARDVAISGSGRNMVASSLVEFMLKLEMALNITPWYARVPTASNVADDRTFTRRS